MAKKQPNKEKTAISPKEFAKGVGPLLGGFFLLYLIVAGNYVGELFNCDLQKMLQTNYLVKHMLGLMTLFFFVTMVGLPGLNWNIWIVVGMTLAMYLLFVVSNRTDARIQIAAIVALFAVYIMQIVRDTYVKDTARRTDEVKDDDYELSDEEKTDYQATIDTNDKTVQRLYTAQYSIGILILVLVAFGFMVYTGKKRLEFGDKFSFLTLLKGSSCRGIDARSYGILESLSALFVGAPPSK